MSLEFQNLVVSYGMGTNSTAMLIGLRERGIRPALIMAADTGDEKPETYAHLEVMQNWCAEAVFPRIVVVRNALPQGIKDGSLYNECLRLGTLPSKSFGFSSCSVKWKVRPQDQYLKKWMAEQGIVFVRHAIGYDADEIERSQKTLPPRTDKENWYPLIEWGWGRDECVAAITRAGLKQPGKSACFMCPSSKKPEIVWLRRTHPDLYSKAITMERRAMAGEGQAPIPSKVVGIGRNWNWETFAGSDVATPETDCGCYDGDSFEEVPA